MVRGVASFYGPSEIYGKLCFGYVKRSFFYGVVVGCKNRGVFFYMSRGDGISGVLFFYMSWGDAKSGVFYFVCLWVMQNLVVFFLCVGGDAKSAFQSGVMLQALRNHGLEMLAPQGDRQRVFVIPCECNAPNAFLSNQNG
jgi:hypothetical protein